MSAPHPFPSPASHKATKTVYSPCSPEGEKYDRLHIVAALALRAYSGARSARSGMLAPSAMPRLTLSCEQVHWVSCPMHARGHGQSRAIWFNCSVQTTHDSGHRDTKDCTNPQQRLDCNWAPRLDLLPV